MVVWSVLKPDAHTTCSRPCPAPVTAPFSRSNTAVLPEHRRRGVATRLLEACERVASRWRYDALWLHVDLHNEAAARLYARVGFEEVSRDPGLVVPRRCLLRKAVQPWGQGQVARPTGPAVALAPSGAGAEGPTRQSGGGGAGRSGVFVWQLQDSES